MDSRPRQIAVEGPPGVGKTSLARLLAERLGARLVLEPSPNPFLVTSEPSRNAFQAQLFGLLGRYQQRGDFDQGDLFQRGGVVADYHFASDRLRAALVLGRDELSLYDRVHGLLKRDLRPPDLLVCLQARPDVLEERVRRAGQAPYPRDHLERSAATYAEYFFHYQESPLLVVNTSEIDFIARKSDLDALVAVIHKTRSGVHHLNPLGSR